MKRAISLILVLSVICGMSVFAHPFGDADGHWADDEIERAYTNNVIGGDPDGLFRPDDIVLRSEFVKMLVAEICEKADVEVSDEYADDEHWASKYYNFGQAMLFEVLDEPVEGVTAGSFTAKNADTPITRWEMAFLVSEAVANSTGYFAGYDTEADYSDIDEINSRLPEEVKLSIASCLGLELMKGDEKNNFKPFENGTRAEAVTIINRVDAMLEKLLESYNEELKAAQDYLEEYNRIIEESRVTYDTIPEGHPVVTVVMQNGKKMVIELYPEYAPQTVANFVKLVKDGFYNGLTFHRFVKGFVAQGGDPNGDGSGGSDGCIVGEFAANGYDGNTLSHTEGVVSMARSQNYNSASSQFFICLDDVSYLDGEYAAFGKVITGLNIIKEYAEGEMTADDTGVEARPKEAVVIKSMTVR